MTCCLLKAHDAKKELGLANRWFTHREAMLVLSSFKAGAARAFLEKLVRLGAFEFLRTWTKKVDFSVFQLTEPAEVKLREELRDIVRT